PEPTATPPTPSSPPPATTSAGSSNGWLSCCPQSWPPSTPRPARIPRSNRPDGVLHRRLENVRGRASTAPGALSQYLCVAHISLCCRDITIADMQQCVNPISYQ